MLVYRIAAKAPTYGADDLTGAGAKQTGGRWNAPGVPVIYAASSRALACLETVVHFTRATSLPFNRYLVEIAIPGDAWAARVRFHDPNHAIGWDAEPPGRVSINWGTGWLVGGSSLLAAVPSVVVPEELNVLINPAHPDMPRVSARIVRKWTYDGRLTASR